MKQEKQNPFIKYNGIKDAKVHIHKTSGLYDASNEHDACGHPRQQIPRIGGLSP